MSVKMKLTIGMTTLFIEADDIGVCHGDTPYHLMREAKIEYLSAWSPDRT